MNLFSHAQIDFPSLRDLIHLKHYTGLSDNASLYEMLIETLFNVLKEYNLANLPETVKN